MSRIRTIKPEFFRHEELFAAELTSGLPLRLAFAGLLTCCDRSGRFRWRPQQLKLDILPYDDVDFSAVLEKLNEHCFIRKYEHDGGYFGFVPSWGKHQTINNREPVSSLPDPNGCQFTLSSTNKTSQESKEAQVDNSKVQNASEPINKLSDDTETNTSKSIPEPLASITSVALSHKTNSLPIPLSEPLSKQSPASTKFSYPLPKQSRPLTRPNTDFSLHVHAQEEGEREKEGEVEKEMEWEEEGCGKEEPKHTVAQMRPRESRKIDVQSVFEFWKQTLNHPNAMLDHKRKGLIQKALHSGYTVAQLCDAITGCSLTPHNIGDNDRGQRFDGLHVILRDADQIDRFINNCHRPPRILNAGEKLWRANHNTVQSWLEQSTTGETHNA